MNFDPREWKKYLKERRRNAVSPHFLPVQLRHNSMSEVNLGYIWKDEVTREVSRCVECRSPKCMDACPAHFDILTMIKNLKTGDFQSAANIVNSFYCIPASFNRICPANCQDYCSVGKKGDPIQIQTIKRFLADHYDKPESFYHVEEPTCKQIAVIGSGPAGLTVAHDLAKLGHKIMVYEKNKILGGMLAVGIPEYRLKNSILLEEIKDLENLGIEFHTGVSFGVDFSHTTLFELGFDAIFLGIGAHKPKFMGIPGEELRGSLHALEFLKHVAEGHELVIGPRVAVIGGGDVAIDAARVANRLDCKASIIYRRTKTEMPATKEEIRETEKEGILINFLTNPVSIIGDGEKVIGIKLIRMRLGNPDDGGRRRPIPIEGSEYIMPIDTVIQAISQEPEVTSIREDYELSRWNTFEIDPLTMETSVKGVFAAGDAVLGPKTAIEAISQAKHTAISIHEYVLNSQSAEREWLVVPK